jgi:hypothetical protein
VRSTNAAIFFVADLLLQLDDSGMQAQLQDRVYLAASGLLDRGEVLDIAGLQH